MSEDPNQSSEPPDLLSIPETVAGGRYVLGAPIGSGGAASVFRARDESLALSRAVKVLRMGHEAIRERFLAEARVLARIRHPNIVRVVDYGEDGGTPWMAMELARGGTLADRLDRGPMPLSRACEVLFEILAGLVVIHDSGFVHRDIKPSNVLFGEGDEAWVSDLGVVSGSEQVVKRHWQTSGPIGTIGYQSPEIRRDARDADHRADIYAAGATLWAMLTARPPIDFSVVSLKPEMLDAIPGSVRPILLRATAHSPSDRYPSCESMARDVATLHSQIKPTASPPDVAMMVFQRLRRRSGMARPVAEVDSLDITAPVRERPYSALSQETPPSPQAGLRSVLLVMSGILVGLLVALVLVLALSV